MRYLLFLLYIITSPNVAHDSPKRIKITVGFYDVISPQLSRELIAAIATQYNAEVYVQPKLQELPTNTYYKPRNRYRADLILKYINQLPGNHDHYLAVTTHDISTTKGAVYDWGVMGLGYQPGKSCVISTYRLKTANTALFKDRFIKVALHEIGQLRGGLIALTLEAAGGIERGLPARRLSLWSKGENEDAANEAMHEARP